MFYILTYPANQPDDSIFCIAYVLLYYFLFYKYVMEFFNTISTLCSQGMTLRAEHLESARRRSNKPIAIILEFIVTGIGDMRSKTRSNRIEYLYGSITPHLADRCRRGV